MDIKKLVGQRIRELRRVRGYSQDKLGELAGVNPKHLSSIEMGHENVTVEVLAKLAHGLDVDVHELFEMEVEERDLKRRLRTLVGEIPKDDLKRIVRLLETLLHG